MRHPVEHQMEGIESTGPFFKNPHLMDSEEEGQVSVSPSSDKTGTITSSEMEVEDGQQGTVARSPTSTPQSFLGNPSIDPMLRKQ